MDVSQLLLLSIAIILILLWICNRRPKNFPPGPFGLPIVGYYPFLGKLPHKKLTELGKKYGNVFSVKLGTSNVVVLNDWPAIKEALITQGDTFTGRPRNMMYDAIFGYDDVAFVDGLVWKDRRRFTLHHLRNLGMGKSSLENVIMIEIRDLMKKMSADMTKAIRIDDYFFHSFLNTIWSLVAGNALECDDKRKTEFFHIAREMLTGMSNTHPLFFMPYLKHVFRKEFNTLRTNVGNYNRFFNKTIDEHLTSYQEDSPRDFVDIGLKEVFHRQNNVQDGSLPFTRNNITQLSKNLFLGGTDTSASTLSWGLLYMAVWPSLQQKVQQELDDVIGRERLPTYTDKNMLPYCNAVLLEILRYSSLLSLSVTRTSMSKTKLFGYTLPKGTLVFTNLWAVHFDPKYWDDPQVFRPERFLNDKGQIEKPEYLIPFSVGGRICLGKVFAEVNVFMFFTCFLHQFSFSVKPGEKLPDFDPIVTLALTPKPFSLVVRQRSNSLVI